MVNQARDLVAQYVYLAQLQAAKGTCKCKACELLRRGADAMTDSVLAQPAGGGGLTADGAALLREAARGAGETIDVEV